MSSADIFCKEKYSRCVALEQDYVHQVYESIGKDLAQAKDPMKDIVRQFLDELEPGSLVADIGCGDGKHLKDKGGVFSVGAERCSLQASLARQKCQEVLIGDNLRLPFRSNAVDAVLSVEVLHHFTTKERRIEALKEISRILKIGGRALITVQRHNNKISQDVLIPWFDVPKEKKVKDDQWFNEGDFEYECNRDDEEDEDSISLPSSDEEDCSWMNKAKFFPPKRNTDDYGWNSQSLNYEITTASKHVPNKLQIVQNNTCYAFVQRAFKRFSTDNTTSNDQYSKAQFGVSDNSPVPINSASENDQTVGLSNCSSLNLDESLLRTISDNFIELLNIDIDEDTSELEKCICATLSNENSNLVKNRRSLMRYFNDIFKNMNSLWSSKSMKSCSDLKSLGATDIHTKEHEFIRNRLVRSRTTTTCTPEFDRIKSLKESKESDMTLSEAVKYINDFLDSSAPGIECVGSSTENGQNKNVITNSDIVNGNTLPLKCSIEKIYKLNSKDHRTNSIQKMPLLKEEDSNHSDLTYDLCLEVKPIISKKEKCDFPEKFCLSFESQPDLFPISESNAKSAICFSQEKCASDKINCMNRKEEKYIFDRNLIEAQLRKEYSFLYDDEFDEDEEEIRKVSAINEYEEQSALFKQGYCMEDYDLESSFFDDENFYFFETIDCDPIEYKSTKTNYDEENFKEFNMNDNSVIYRKGNSLANETRTNTFSKPSIKSNVNYSDLKIEDEVRECDCCLGACSSNSQCILQSSPKKRRKTNHSENYECSELNMLGPFYDEDNDSTYTNVDLPLATYYSMPELHALSEFYDEYVLYQNYLLDTLTPERLNYQYSYFKSSNMQTWKENTEIKSNLLKSEKLDADSQKDNEIQTINRLDAATSEINTGTEKKPEISEKFKVSLILEKKDLKDSSISQSSIEDMKIELCNSIQTAFTTTNSSLIENKLDNISTIPEITFENEKSDLPISIQLKSDSFTDLDNKLTSKYYLNNTRSAIECYNNSIYFQSLGISRSCSSLLENANFNKLVEIPSLSNISASQPSLKFSPKQDLKLNLNKYRLNQINLYHSLSSDILADENMFSNFLKRTSVENIYCKQNTCALTGFKRGSDETVQLVNNILEKCPHQVSYISSPNSNRISEFSPKLSKRALNDDLRPHSPLLISSNNYIDNVLDNEKLSICGNCKNSHSAKLTDSYCENGHFSTLFQNNKQHSESVSSKKNPHFLENSVYSVRDLKNANKKIYLDEHSDEILIESSKNSSVSDSSLQNFTNTVVTYEHSPHTYSYKNPLHYSTENISKSEQQTSLLQATNSVLGKRDTKCTIYRNDEVPTNGKSMCNISPIAVDNLDQIVVKARDTDISEQIHAGNVNPAEEKANEHSLQKTGIDDECTHYTYGKIHADGTAVVSHRYHHLFQEEELYDLIENNISDLHVLDSFVEELHLCIIAEKVRVWTI